MTGPATRRATRPVPSRRRTLLVALGVGVVFLAGLVIHGPVGGVLLVLVAATMLLITYGTWGRVAPSGRPLQVLVLVAVVAVAAAKLAGKL